MPFPYLGKNYEYIGPYNDYKIVPYNSVNYTITKGLQISLICINPDGDTVKFPISSAKIDYNKLISGRCVPYTLFGQSPSTVSFKISNLTPIEEQFFITAPFQTDNISGAPIYTYNPLLVNYQQFLSCTPDQDYFPIGIIVDGIPEFINTYQTNSSSPQNFFDYTKREYLFNSGYDTLTDIELYYISRNYNGQPINQYQFRKANTPLYFISKLQYNKTIFDSLTTITEHRVYSDFKL